MWQSYLSFSFTKHKLCTQVMHTSSAHKLCAQVSSSWAAVWTISSYLSPYHFSLSWAQTIPHEKWLSKLILSAPHDSYCGFALFNLLFNSATCASTLLGNSGSEKYFEANSLTFSGLFCKILPKNPVRRQDTSGCSLKYLSFPILVLIYGK